MSQERVYRRDGEVYPKPGTPEPPALRAAKKNDLVLGIRKFRMAGGSSEEPDVYAGEAKDIGKDLVEGLLDAKVFKEVHYPLRDEKVDVEIEPIVYVELQKNRFTNAIKVFPGILFPWIDGFGFDYDHMIKVDLVVRDAQHPDVVCDTFKGRSVLTAERYPSIFWFCGLHAGLFILLVFETVTTDDATCKLLVDKNAGEVDRAGIEWLMKEFAPTARACPNHPDVKTGKFCAVCGASLRYPILNKVNGAKPKP